ncbi:MAG: hypothetical protein ACI87J_000542 [Colwellia sp.]|jgi:hypothetical protein
MKRVLPQPAGRLINRVIDGDKHIQIRKLDSFVLDNIKNHQFC